MSLVMKVSESDTDLGSLKRHKESIHEGVRYSCDKCDYKATILNNLKRHIKGKHQGS